MKKAKKMLHCHECGEALDNKDYQVDDNIYCEECYYDNFEECYYCNEVHSKDDLTFIESEEVYVCDNCLDDNYTRCEDCGDYINTNRDYYHTIINPNGYDYNVCDNCYSWSGNYARCEECEDEFHVDDLHEHNNEYYCESCYEERFDSILDYHEFNENCSWQFYKDDNEIPKYYIGAEIELEPKEGCNSRSVLNAMHNHLNAVAEGDGSLNYGGIEIKIQPETFNYKLKNKEKTRQFFNEIEELGYGHCGHSGLHFHISRPNDEVISRIIVIMESFKDEIKKLSRRRESQLNEWANFLTDEFTSSEEVIKYRSKKWLKDNWTNSRGHKRYLALNLQNDDTIEFRFFNGVNNFEEYWGALQFIHNLVEVALDETRELNTIKWMDLIVGEELENQAKRLGVYGIDKVAKDTTEIYDKLKDVQRLTKVHIIKVLDNMIKYIENQMSKTTFEELKNKDIDVVYDKANAMLYQVQNELQFLTEVIHIRKNIDESTSIDTIKYAIERKANNKYSRYFKEMSKIFRNYEMEVAV